MEPLKSVRRIIALLGVYSFDEYTANWSKVGRFLFVSAILVGNTGASLSGIVYIYKQEISVHTLCLVTGMGNMAIMMMVALIQRDKITGIVDHLLDAYKKLRANTESEWIYGQYIIWYIYVALLSIFLMYPISVVVWLRSGSSFDASLLFQMYHISLPWNQQTPLGYVAEMCFHLFCCTTYCLSVSLIVLFISVTLYQRAFYEMFKYSSDQIEPSDAHMKTNICQMVKFHIFAKDSFFKSAEAFSTIITTMMLCIAIMLAAFVFQTFATPQIQQSTLETVFTTAFLALHTGLNTALPFMYCFYGQMSSDSFSQMADCSYGVSWYGFPLKHQRSILAMITNAQIPLQYMGSDVLIVNLETFKGLISTVYKCYMFLKTTTG